MKRRLRKEDKRVSDEVLSAAYDRLMDSSFGLEMGGAPKAMADMVESLAGQCLWTMAFVWSQPFRSFPAPTILKISRALKAKVSQFLRIHFLSACTSILSSCTKVQPGADLRHPR